MSESSSEGSYSESEIEAFINAFNKAGGRAEICIGDQVFQADMKDEDLTILGLIVDGSIKQLNAEQVKMFTDLGMKC